VEETAVVVDSAAEDSGAEDLGAEESAAEVDLGAVGPAEEVDLGAAGSVEVGSATGALAEGEEVGSAVEVPVTEAVVVVEVNSERKVVVVANSEE
jgi:hypothetical protein